MLIVIHKSDLLPRPQHSLFKVSLELSEKRLACKGYSERRLRMPHPHPAGRIPAQSRAEKELAVELSKLEGNRLDRLCRMWGKAHILALQLFSYANPNPNQGNYVSSPFLCLQG